MLRLPRRAAADAGGDGPLGFVMETTERQLAGQKAQDFFEDLWKGGDAHWNFETSAFEQAKYARQFALIRDRRYARALEIGCGSGCFTRLLSEVADEVAALDIAPSAIARARSLTAAKNVEYREANVMDYDLRGAGAWDLIVMSETIYYLGWLYSFFDVGWLASQLFDATQAVGRRPIDKTRSGGGRCPACSLLVSPH